MEGPDYGKIHKELFIRVQGYAEGVRLIYMNIMEHLIALTIEAIPCYDPEVPFAFSDYPQISERANGLLRELYSRVYQEVRNGITNEWEQANLVNDKLVTALFGSRALEEKHFAKYFSRNKEAMDAFFTRKSKERGLDLSKRIWKYEGQFRQEMEMAIDACIGRGMSAARMTSKVKEYLNEPDKLFRRVRNERGELVLSKNAKAYHPGQGIYRSSYKNAMRVTRTETNIAYLSSDHERRLQFDFVVGIRTKLSNRHTEYDICDELAGDYPKWFKFTGFHPLCLCHAEAILVTREELGQMTGQILSGENPSVKSVREVKRTPHTFDDWVRKNKERIRQAEKNDHLPYFLRDNKEYYEKILKGGS